VVAEADRALLQFTVVHLVVTPQLRRKLLVLLVMSLSTIVGFWAVSTWLPQYASQIATAGGWLADVWGRKPSTWLYYLGALPGVWVPFLLVHDPVLFPVLFLVAVGLNGFFTTGQFAWMPIYLPELFPTGVRGTAVSLVFNSARYVAAFGPLAAGWAITTFGGIPAAASIIALIYVLGLLLPPFAGPETKGRPLPS